MNEPSAEPWFSMNYEDFYKWIMLRADPPQRAVAALKLKLQVGILSDCVDRLSKLLETVAKRKAPSVPGLDVEREWVPGSESDAMDLRDQEAQERHFPPKEDGK